MKASKAAEVTEAEVDAANTGNAAAAKNTAAATNAADATYGANTSVARARQSQTFITVSAGGLRPPDPRF